MLQLLMVQHQEVEVDADGDANATGDGNVATICPTGTQPLIGGNDRGEAVAVVMTLFMSGIILQMEGQPLVHRYQVRRVQI